MKKIILVMLSSFYLFQTYCQDVSFADLRIDARYWSPSRTYFVTFQGDGNLVVYTSAEKPVWDTKTNGKGARACVMQGDGNLVLYNDATPIWNSETCCYPGVKTVLQMQDDGNLVIVACLNCYWIPLWSWMTGKWNSQQITDFPNTHPNGAKCCPPLPPPPPPPPPPNTEQWVCSVANIPTGWVIVDIIKCVCCDSPAGSLGTQWKIKNITNLPSGSIETICPSSIIPSGWVVVDRFQCICCGSPAGALGQQIKIKRL